MSNLKKEKKRKTHGIWKGQGSRLLVLDIAVVDRFAFWAETLVGDVARIERQLHH